MSLAIFDLDNTLLRGDSDHLWGQYLVEIGVVDASTYAAQNDQFFADYQAGTLDIQAFQRFCLQPLANNNMTDLLRWRGDFVEAKIRPLITPAALDLVQQHRQANDILLIITATNHFVTRPIADCFGIEHLIGTVPEQIGERFTGAVSGIPSFHSGKVERLHAWCQPRHLELTGAYFYSDSHNDLPLLQLVPNAVAVNPDEILRAHAIKQQWPILDLPDPA